MKIQVSQVSVVLFSAYFLQIFKDWTCVEGQPQPSCRPLNNQPNQKNQLSWQWQVQIFWKNKYLCEGTLIRPSGKDTLVLTSAQCAKKLQNNVTSTKILVGAVWDRIGNDTNPTTFNVTGIVIHPDYSSREKLNDIALLAADIKPTSYLMPVCLPEVDDDPHEGHILGVKTNGTLSSAKALRLYFQPETVHSLSSSDCVSNGVFSEPSSSQFCVEKSNGTCSIATHGFGFITESTQNGVQYSTIRGIANLVRGGGYPCGFSTYTRVGFHLAWIKSTENQLRILKAHQRSIVEINSTELTNSTTTFSGDFPATNYTSTQLKHIYLTTAGDYIVPLCAAIVICFAAIGTTGLCLRFHIYRKSKNLKNEIREFLYGTEIPMGSINGCVDSMPYDTEYEIDDSELQIGQTVLGYGSFGTVFSGFYQGKPVAVKTIKNENQNEYWRNLLSELKVMIYLKNHANLVGLVGASTKSLQRGSLYIVVDLCTEGNLINYLRKHRDFFETDCFEGIQQMDCRAHRIDGNKEQGLSICHLLKWACQIASAMEYLESKKVIHADLAARNVLITEGLIVKVSDFGMSRQLYETMEYVKKHQEPLPWRWMAPESLQMLHFSSQSDVWAFGVTLWEMFTLGDIPYPGLTYKIDFPLRLAEGLRLYRPPYAPCKIFELMIKCWSQNPQARPNFSSAKFTLLEVWNKHFNLEEYTHLEFN